MEDWNHIEQECGCWSEHKPPVPLTKYQPNNNKTLQLRHQNNMAFLTN